jgi:hypothetical protein
LLTDDILRKLYTVQDEVLEENLAEVSLASDFRDLISTVCKVCASVLPRLPFPDPKNLVLRAWAADALTGAMVATRVGLWGNLPESMSVLRPSIERTAQLLHIVTQEAYKTADYERSRGRFTQLAYEKIVDGLSIGKGTKELHGRVSDLAAHATARSMVWGSYKSGEENYLRLGVSRDRDVPPVVLFYCANTVILVMNALEGAFQQEGRVFSLSGDTESLYQQYGVLKERILGGSAEQAEESSVGHSSH